MLTLFWGVDAETQTRGGKRWGRSSMSNAERGFMVSILFIFTRPIAPVCIYKATKSLNNFFMREEERRIYLPAHLCSKLVPRSLILIGCTHIRSQWMLWYLPFQWQGSHGSRARVAAYGGSADPLKACPGATWGNGGPLPQGASSSIEASTPPQRVRKGVEAASDTYWLRELRVKGNMSGNS